MTLRRLRRLRLRCGYPREDTRDRTANALACAPHCNMFSKGVSLQAPLQSACAADKSALVGAMYSVRCLAVAHATCLCDMPRQQHVCATCHISNVSVPRATLARDRDHQ
eukprot:360575-Chlamydomonas_euryale.AAC.2